MPVTDQKWTPRSHVSFRDVRHVCRFADGFMRRDSTFCKRLDPFLEPFLELLQRAFGSASSALPSLGGSAFLVRYIP